MSTATTSHIERQNLTVRMQTRRMTRLTNAFSKKWENHQASMMLYAAYYNFCRVHQFARYASDGSWNHQSHMDLAGIAFGLEMTVIQFVPCPDDKADD
jgi:cell fate regulator YaaT (PSP1 superfamily)